MSLARLALALPLLLTPAFASAVTIAPQVLPFSLAVEGGGTLSGTLTVLEVVQGSPAGFFTTTGAAAPQDVTVILQLALDPTSLPWGGDMPDEVPHVLASWWHLRSGTPLSAGGVGTGGAYVGVGATTQDWAVVDTSVSGVLTPALAPGSTTSPFFVSYPALAAGETIELYAGYDLLTPGFPIRYAHLGTLAVVPEPAGATTLLLGLLALRWIPRRAA